MQTHADSMQTGLYQSEMTSDINLSQIEVRLDHFRFVCMNFLLRMLHIGDSLRSHGDTCRHHADWPVSI